MTAVSVQKIKRMISVLILKVFYEMTVCEVVI